MLYAAVGEGDSMQQNASLLFDLLQSSKGSSSSTAKLSEACNVV